MSTYNKNAYYFIPIAEITPEMLSFMSNGSLKTIRKSVRPIDGKIMGICKHGFMNPAPKCFENYKAYSHEETLNLMQSKAWNLYAPLQEIRRNYDFNDIYNKFENNLFIESCGRMYITVFSILKFKFYQFSFDFLKKEYKWKIFNSPKFEKANESTMLMMNSFFDLIDFETFEKIEKFRLIRNSISHSFEEKYTPQEIELSLRIMNEFIEKEFNSHPF